MSHEVMCVALCNFLCALILGKSSNFFHLNQETDAQQNAGYPGLTVNVFVLVRV